MAKSSQLEAMSSHKLDRKRHKGASHPALDEGLINWVLQCQHKRIFLTGDVIKTKAEQFAKKMSIPDDEVPLFSNGWLEKFKKRHSLNQFQTHGESGSVNPDTAVDCLQKIKLYVRNIWTATFSI